MKKYNLSKIMKRAWDLELNCITTVKKKTGFARIREEV